MPSTAIKRISYGSLQCPVLRLRIPRIGKPNQGGYGKPTSNSSRPCPFRTLPRRSGRHRGPRATTPRAMDATPPSPAGGDRPALRAGAGAPSGALALARTANVAGDDGAARRGACASQPNAASGPTNGSTKWKRRASRRFKRRLTAAADAKCASSAASFVFTSAARLCSTKFISDEAGGRLG